MLAVHRPTIIHHDTDLDPPLFVLAAIHKIFVCIPLPDQYVVVDHRACRCKVQQGHRVLRQKCHMFCAHARMAEVTQPILLD